MNLIIFILACLGATNIIVFGEIFEKIRDFIERKFKYSLLNSLINCTTCMGFHVGWILALIFPVLGLNWFLAACIGSIVNNIYSKLETLI